MPDHKKSRPAGAEPGSPLAENMRPKNLDAFVGQDHTVGPGSLIRHAVERDRVFSMVLWGPPGCGKTTLARIIAKETRAHFVQISAVLSGVKDIRAVIEEAKSQVNINRKTILFVDEIHRFNKSQQDAFLHHVESGLITLIGATTENPSFEVIPALMSRCRVITLNALTEEEIARIIRRALADSQNGLGGAGIVLSPEALVYLSRLADGDARVALNNLEAAVSVVLGEATNENGPLEVGLEILQTALQKKALLYYKAGEEHYNLISALHKSLRGSDPDAALYWLGRMLAAGEDPLYIARRMVRFATEDIGNADPNALTTAINATEAFRFLGHPEGDLALAQAAVYLATAPKSNAVYTSYSQVQETIRATGALPVPLHIRNAPTSLMKSIGYGKGYKYAHNYTDAVVEQEHLPDKLRGRKFYNPSNRGYEKVIKQRLDKWREYLARRRKENRENDNS